MKGENAKVVGGWWLVGMVYRCRRRIDDDYFLHLPDFESRACISFAASVPPFSPGERENERTSGRADEGSTSERERVSRSAVGRDEDTIRTKGHEQDGDRGDRGGDENRARRCLDVADLGERQQRLQGHRHGSRRSHSAVVSFRRERGEANASSDGQSRRCRHARDHRGDRWADK